MTLYSTNIGKVYSMGKDYRQIQYEHEFGIPRILSI